MNYLILRGQLLALLLLRHALTITDPDGDDDASAFFSVSRIEICFLKFERKNNVYNRMGL